MNNGIGIRLTDTKEDDPVRQGAWTQRCPSDLPKFSGESVPASWFPCLNTHPVSHWLSMDVNRGPQWGWIMGWITSQLHRADKSWSRRLASHVLSWCSRLVYNVCIYLYESYQQLYRFTINPTLVLYFLVAKKLGHIFFCSLAGIFASSLRVLRKPIWHLRFIQPFWRAWKTSPSCASWIGCMPTAATLQRNGNFDWRNSGKNCQLRRFPLKQNDANGPEVSEFPWAGGASPKSHHPFFFWTMTLYWNKHHHLGISMAFPILRNLLLGVSINGGTQNGWFLVENPMKMDDS